MIFKGIAATTEVDRHNCQITKETLENAMVFINEGKYVPGVGLEHGHSVMPIGKTIKGQIVPYRDGEFAAQIHQDIFFDEFKERITDTGEKVYIGESQYDHRPFADTEKDDISKLEISIDPVNFLQEDYEELIQYITDDCDANYQDIIRKSLIPDPEIVFTLAAGTLMFWTGKKALEKLADNVATDIASCYTRIKKAAVKFAQYAIPKNRPITYVFRESNEYVTEFVIQTTCVDTMLEAIQKEYILSALEKTNQVKLLVNGAIAKIQFLYDCRKKEWEFNYLTSTTGQVIGTEKCYRKTAKVFENVITGASSQCSVSGELSKCNKNGENNKMKPKEYIIGQEYVHGMKKEVTMSFFISYPQFFPHTEVENRNITLSFSEGYLIIKYVVNISEKLLDDMLQNHPKANKYLWSYFNDILPYVNFLIQNVRYEKGLLLCKPISMYDVNHVALFENNEMIINIQGLVFDEFPKTFQNLKNDELIYLRDYMDVLTAKLYCDYESCIKKIITSIENYFIKSKTGGDSFDKKLKKSMEKMADDYVKEIIYNNIKYIYKLRNKIVHDTLRINHYKPEWQWLCHKGIGTLQYFYEFVLEDNETIDYVHYLTTQYLLINNTYSASLCQMLQDEEIYKKESMDKIPIVDKNFFFETLKKENDIRDTIEEYCS